MRTSYGVVWRDGVLPLARGKLELLPRSLRLEGMADSRPTEREVAYESLAGVHIGRLAAERLGGRSTLVLERLRGEPIAIAAVAQTGVVAELAERLARLQLGAQVEARIAVMVPLKEGAHYAARRLLASGPPFDPDGTRLDRHQVFLTREEVVFVFESRLGCEALERLLAEPQLWREAAAWRELSSGPPRIAEDVYSWARPVAGMTRSRRGPCCHDRESFDF